MVGAVRLERTVFRLKVGGFTTKLYTHIGGKGETCTHIGGFSVHCIDYLCYRSKLEEKVRFELTITELQSIALPLGYFSK